MTSFAFEPIYGSIALASLVAFAALGVILWVTPPTENAQHRRWLILLRLAATLVLLLALFRPAIFRTDNRPAEASLVVAADVSRSMTLPDGDGQTRWETQNRVWQRLAESMDGVDGSLDLRLLVYDDAGRTIANANAESLNGETPDGDLTDLSAAAVGNPVRRRAADRRCRADRRRNADGAASGIWCPTCRRNTQLTGRATVDRSDRTRRQFFGITRSQHRRPPGESSTIRRQRSFDRLSSSDSRTCQHRSPITTHLDRRQWKSDRGGDSDRRAVRIT